MKRWLPFIVLIGGAIGFSLYMLLFEDVNPYMPASNDPLVVYREACAHCHGEKGEGTGLLYPALNSEELTPDRVRKSLQEGSFLMPSFPNIKGALLDSMAQVIMRASYKDR